MEAAVRLASLSTLALADPKTDFGMDTTFDDLTADGSCTSCEVEEDHSAYWTPGLYFQYSNGTTVMVQQVGGMLA